MGVTLSAIPELSLNTNPRMYLYNIPRDTMTKDPMFQSLCSTSTWNALELMPNISNYIFMCSRASRSTPFVNHSSVLELLAQHKTSHQSCAWRSTPNTDKHIYISSIIVLRPKYKKTHHGVISSGVFDPIYQNKISR